MPTISSPLETVSELTVHQNATSLTTPQKARRRALVIPREHGAWGMLLIPLVTGAAVGLFEGGKLTPVLLLLLAVLALFWLRTPAESWLGTNGMRAQTKEERRAVWAFILPLSSIAGISLGVLLWRDKMGYLLWIGVIAGFTFGAQMLLKRLGRATRMAAEIVGAFALTSTAPAAYCAATGRLDSRAGILWLVNWLFAANQVHFVWLTIRGMRAARLNEKLSIGWSFLVAQILLGTALALIYHFGFLPQLALLAFAPVLFRGFLWFIRKPVPLVVRRLGWSEFAHAVVFGVLLITGFYFR